MHAYLAANFHIEASALRSSANAFQSSKFHSVKVFETLMRARFIAFLNSAFSSEFSIAFFSFIAFVTFEHCPSDFQSFCKSFKIVFLRYEAFSMLLS